jgi:hypothetical protein
MRGAGAGRTTTTAGHLPPRPVEPVIEPADRSDGDPTRATTDGAGIRDGMFSRHEVRAWVAAANAAIAPGLLIQKGA